jgi:hypothetical protein
MDQMTDIPYFTLRDGMNSTLTLNNVGPAPTPVTVTIYNMEGKAQVLAPITLAPHSFKQIELRDVVVGDDFDSGNLKVAYNGISMGLTCQVSVSNPEKRVSFESRDVWGQQDMKDMMPSMTTNLSGILSLPQETAEGFLTVTNIGTNKVTVQVSTGSKPKTVALYSRQTRLVKLSDEADQRGPRAFLVKLQHDGMPGDIVTTGFVLDLKLGYSSAFTMLDPGLMTSSHLAGAHLRIGKPDASEGFPERTQFRSPLLLANIGLNSVNAHVSIDYTLRKASESSDSSESTDGDGVTEGRFSTATINNLTIAPGTLTRIELSDALEKLGIDSISEAGVDIDYDTAPGTLIGNLVSVDQTGDYSFEVPIKDPSAMMEMMEGIYPWNLDNGNNTVLHLKNTTNKPVTGLLVFDYLENGAVQTYNPPGIILKPYQTVAIDIQKLRDSKKPDVRGQIFPPNITEGQVQWRQEIPYSMIGRAEQTNVKEGIARSFSCGYSCCLWYTEDDTLDPSPVDIGVNGSATLVAHKSGIGCNDLNYGPTVITAGTWTSGLSAIVTVSSGLVSYVGDGNTSVSASVLQNYYDDGGTCSCHHHTQSVPVSAGVRAGPYPVGYQISTFTTNAGALQFKYVWGSSTGNLADLSGCVVGEIVTYPGAPLDYNWPSPPFPHNPTIHPNPAVIDLAATPGFLNDNHIWYYGSQYGGFVKPYTSSSFSAYQYYRYKCGHSTDYTILAGLLTITRSVGPSTGTNWKYTITKTGGYTTGVDPLP